jgi:hypothetical protein
MRTLLIITAASVALAACQTFPGRDRAGHGARGPHAMAGGTMDEAAMHEMCKAMMGDKMKPKQVHDHGRDKTGHATWPNGKPLSKSEMRKMHKMCADKMSHGGAPK